MEDKRNEVLAALCNKAKAFGIEIDYVFEDGREYLVCDGQKILTTINSLSAIHDELVGYIFITTYSRTSIAKIINGEIKEYWMD